MPGLFDDDAPGAAPSIGTGLLGGGLPAVVQDAAVIVRAPVGTTLDSIPVPHAPLGDGPLSPEEEQEFAACKAGMDNLQQAFWVAGKSLETMARGNLARESGFATFADFVWETWEVSESQAYRLMQEWRVGEELAALGWRPRESQVRELTDIIRDAGNSAAVAVYDAVARETGKVTAKLLKSVVRQLPPLGADAPLPQVQKAVRDVLRPPRQPAEPQPEGMDPAAAEPSEHGEPAGEAQEDAVPEEVEALTTALRELQAATKRLNKARVRRALEVAPEDAGPLVADIKEQLDRLGRIVAVRPSTTA